MAYWQVGGPTNKQNLRASPPLANELDHHSLVDDCGGMLDARGVLLRGLAQTTRELGALALFIPHHPWPFLKKFFNFFPNFALQFSDNDIDVLCLGDFNLA